VKLSNRRLETVSRRGEDGGLRWIVEEIMRKPGECSNGAVISLGESEGVGKVGE